MKPQPTFATLCQRDVLRTEIASPLHVHIVFVDQSEFVFRTVQGSALPDVNGGTDSLAARLRSQARTFTYLAAGVMIKFTDGSSCSLNFGQKIAAAPSPTALAPSRRVATA